MATANPQKALKDSFGEVISSSNEMIIVQCYKENNTDKSSNSHIIQGSTIKAVSSYDNSYAAYGLVTKINNSSLDNIHKPSALGLSREQLEQLHPQVYDLLRKELEIYLFAYSENNQIFSYTPQKPMMIHDFVCKTNEKEVLEITNNFSTLINLIKRNQLKADLLINMIIEGYRLRKNDEEYLINVGKELSLAFLDEVEPLMNLLKRLSQIK